MRFVLRDSYSDTMDLIKQKRLDVAWLSDYPYVLMETLGATAGDAIERGPALLPRLDLIVPARDRRSRSIADLEGKVFAYAIARHTGYLFPRHELTALAKSPKTFFTRTFFTWSHRKAIEACGQHLADGAAVVKGCLGCAGA